jgi:hypothetical protein
MRRASEILKQMAELASELSTVIDCMDDLEEMVNDVDPDVHDACYPFTGSICEMKEKFLKYAEVVGDAEAILADRNDFEEKYR